MVNLLAKAYPMANGPLAEARLVRATQVVIQGRDPAWKIRLAEVIMMELPEAEFLTTEILSITIAHGEIAIRTQIP